MGELVSNVGRGSLVVVMGVIAGVAASSTVNAGPGDFDPWTHNARYELEHRVDLSSWADNDPGSVRVWLPMPSDTKHQRLVSSSIDSPWPYRETGDANGNRFAYVVLDGTSRNSNAIVMRFTVDRWPHDGIDKSHAAPGSALDPARYVGAQRRIPLTGQVKEYADAAGVGLETDAARIRAYYDYVTAMMQYGEHGRGWGRGDAAWACDAKYGNCTDFHSVIIGMCRSQGIPARFVIGFPMPGDASGAPITGYHCWTEAFDREYGWVPMDASEAWKLKRFDNYYGRLPSDRVEYVVGRDLILEPPQQGEPLNYFVYPYAEVDGQPAGDIPWTLRVRRVGSRQVSSGPASDQGSSATARLPMSSESIPTN